MSPGGGRAVRCSCSPAPTPTMPGAICVVPALGMAPANVPARQDNIWGGFNHEPVPDLSIAE